MGERSVRRSGLKHSLRRLARRQVAALSLAGVVLLLVTAGALAVTGDLTQPAGTAGCISETGTGGTCADGHGLIGPADVAVSADGKSVYVPASTSDAVVRLNRNTTTGAITQPAGTAGCISETGTGGTCADGHGLDGAGGVAVSPNGKTVYVASFTSDAVVRFNRAP
jgi:sugar lactone lactonase YvrE